jgi:hypothetical protein
MKGETPPPRTYVNFRASPSEPGPCVSHHRSRALFSDPDGNVWHMQEVSVRDPKRSEPGATSFSSAANLASALRRAEAAHGEHEKRTGQHDANWADWYAAYIVAEQSGADLPQ